MPIFEYKCKKCGTVFERLVARTESQVTCDRCGSMRVEKLFSTFSANVASMKPNPCSEGGCPSTGMAGTGCSGGGCPFSQPNG